MVVPEATGDERQRLYDGSTGSDALIQHATHLGSLSGAILATGSVSGVLLGEASTELGAILADGPVRLFTPYLSM